MTDRKRAASAWAPAATLAFCCLLLAACQPDPPRLTLLLSDERAAAEGDTLEFRFGRDRAVDLLIEVRGTEVEFDVAARHAGDADPGRRLRLPYLRVGPVYELLTARPAPDEVVVRVRALHATRSGRVALRAFELPGGPAGESLSRAYRLYSDALRATDSEAPEVWRPRVAGLSQAAELFGRWGMEEERLWTRFLAGFFTFYPLYDYRGAIDALAAVEQDAAAAGFPVVSLMAMQLRAQAMIEHDDADNPDQAAAKYEEAQALFDKIVARSESLGLPFEAAWAINAKGIGHYYRAHHEQALAQYRLALARAEALQDRYLVSLVRGNMALAQESLGQDARALASLQAIYRDINDEADTDLRVLNLSEQGRIYRDLFLFPQAVSALNEALSLAVDSAEDSGRIRLWLARCYYEMGMMERARSLLDEALPAMKAANYARGLREGYRLSASLYRLAGDYEAMRSAREAQSALLNSDDEGAYFAYERARDALASGEGGSSEPLRLLRQARALAGHGNDETLQRILRLETCWLDRVAGTMPDDCSLDRLQTNYEAVLQAGTPRESMAAGQAWAEILADAGRRNEAIGIYQALVGQMAHYRASLPGVLGASYWERREPVFAAYLGLLLQRDLERGSGAGSLLAFDSLRNFELGVESGDGEAGQETPGADDATRLRELIARRARAASPEEAERIERELDVTLLAAAEGGAWTRRSRDAAWLRQALGKLPADAAVLAYYLRPDSVYAWTARRDGVTLRRMEVDTDLSLQLIRARENLLVIGAGPPLDELSRLGETLVGGADNIPGGSIYLLGAGALNGFPFDALRVGGRFLGQDRQVVNLSSLAALVSLGSRFARPDRVFLAGDPQGGQGGGPALAAAGPELQAVAARFPAAQVTLAQGEEFTARRFETAAFAQADLVHIASHARIDLAYPALSTLTLSVVGTDVPARPTLTPRDFRHLPMSARLVVLSACETIGLNRFRFDGNMGFVSALHQQGVPIVLASLWPVADRATAAFMGDFYSGLAAGFTPAEALYAAKRERINSGGAQRLASWAAFQLYRN